MNSREQQLNAFNRLLDVMDELRAKCPWDKKQTLESLSYLTIEETYELVDAILEKDMVEIRKELGDLFLHLVFYSKIGSETNDFDVADVLNGVCEKLIERHPHIYGDVIAETEEEVKQNWEQIKLKEKGGNKTILEGVPKSLPAMVKAQRIQEKARGAGFDWNEKSQVWEKVKEELAEFEEASIANDSENIESEFGDLIFSLINYARFINVSPENALERTNKKFIKRFNFLEKESKKDGKEMGNMTLEEMDEYWERAKKI